MPVAFCSPLEDHTLQDFLEIITQPLITPPPGKDTGHHGVDFAYFRRGDRLSIAGVTVQAVMAGTVAASIENRVPYGNMVIIETAYQDMPQEIRAALGVQAGESLYVLVAHMAESPLVSLGEAVECGQALGQVGNTPVGWSSDPHLHLEIRAGLSGETFDGMVYYDSRAKPEEMANYERWRMSGDFRILDPLVMLQVGLAEEDTP